MESMDPVDTDERTDESSVVTKNVLSTSAEVEEHMKSLHATASSQITIMGIICQNLDRVELELEKRFAKFEKRMRGIEFNVTNIVHNLQGSDPDEEPHSATQPSVLEPFQMWNKARQVTLPVAMFRRGSKPMPRPEDFEDMDMASDEPETERDQEERPPSSYISSDEEGDNGNEEDKLEHVPEVVEKVVERQNSQESKGSRRPASPAKSESSYASTASLASSRQASPKHKKKNKAPATKSPAKGKRSSTFKPPPVPRRSPGNSPKDRRKLSEASRSSSHTWSTRFARELARRRWRWAFEQVKVLQRQSRTRLSVEKLAPGFSFGARLTRLEDAMANVVSELENRAPSTRRPTIMSSFSTDTRRSKHFSDDGGLANSELWDRVGDLSKQSEGLEELRRKIEEKEQQQKKESEFLRAQLARFQTLNAEAETKLKQHEAETKDVKEQLDQLHESVGVLGETIKSDREKKREVEEWERRKLALECTTKMAELIEDLNHVIKLKPVLNHDLEIESLQELVTRMGLILKEGQDSDLGLYGTGDLLESACMHVVNILHRDSMERDDLEPGEEATLDTFPCKDGTKGDLVERVNGTLESMKEVLHHLTNQGTLTLAINEMRTEMSLLVRRTEFDPIQEQIENVIQRMNRKMERTDLEKAMEHKLNKTEAQVSMDNLMDAIAELQENMMENHGSSVKGGGHTLSEQEKQQFKKLQKAIRDHQENFHKLKEELGDKAASEEVTTSLNYINAQLRRVQNESVHREHMDLALRNKVDKKDLSKLAQAISGFGEHQDGDQPVAGSRLRCLSCDRPLRGLGATGNAVLLNPHQHERAAGDPVYEMTLGPVKTPPKMKSSNSRGSARGRHKDGRPETGKSEGDDEYTSMDGKVLSRYSRVMPMPSRVRTAAGGGGAGNGNMGGLKSLKEKSNTQLLNKIQKMR